MTNLPKQTTRRRERSVSPARIVVSHRNFSNAGPGVVTVYNHVIRKSCALNRLWFSAMSDVAESPSQTWYRIFTWGTVQSISSVCGRILEFSHVDGFFIFFKCGTRTYRYVFFIFVVGNRLKMQPDIDKHAKREADTASCADTVVTGLTSWHDRQQAAIEISVKKLPFMTLKVSAFY